MTNEQLRERIVQRLQALDMDDRGEYAAGVAHTTERAEEIVLEEFARIADEQAIVAPLVARAISAIVEADAARGAGKITDEQADERAGAYFERDTVVAIARALKKVVDGRPLRYIEWKSCKDPQLEEIKANGRPVVVCFNDRDGLRAELYMSLVRWNDGAWVRESDGSIRNGLAVLYFELPNEPTVGMS